MKDKIEKILDNTVGIVHNKDIASSLTSLIIKWLESKKGGRRICFGEDCTKDRVKYRNQLITELVEEMK